MAIQNTFIQISVQYLSREGFFKIVIAFSYRVLYLMRLNVSDRKTSDITKLCQFALANCYIYIVSINIQNILELAGNQPKTYFLLYFKYPQLTYEKETLGYGRRA